MLRYPIATSAGFALLAFLTTGVTGPSPSLLDPSEEGEIKLSRSAMPEYWDYAQVEPDNYRFTRAGVSFGCVRSYGFEREFVPCQIEGEFLGQKGDTGAALGYHSHGGDRPEMGKPLALVFSEDQLPGQDKRVQGETTDGPFGFGTVRFWAPPAAGVYRMEVLLKGAGSGGFSFPPYYGDRGTKKYVIDIDVKVPGLEELPCDMAEDNRPYCKNEEARYIVSRGEFVQTDPAHPHGHHGRPEGNARAVALAEIYYEETQHFLSFNDISLPWGGAFDMNENWSPPHATHLDGRHYDVNRIDFDPYADFDPVLGIRPGNETGPEQDYALEDAVSDLNEEKTGDRQARYPVRFSPEDSPGKHLQIIAPQDAERPGQ